MKKHLASFFLFLALAPFALAQIVTFRGSVTRTSGSLVDLVPLGAKVTDIFQITSLAPQRAVGPGFLYDDHARESLSVDALGEVFNSTDVLFTIQDEPWGYGVIAGFVELWSNSSDVISDAFLSSPVDITKFDRINSGGYGAYPNYFVWQIESAQISNASPVPEPSAYGIMGIATTIGIVVISRRRLFHGGRV